MEIENVHLKASEFGQSIEQMWDNLMNQDFDPSYDNLIKTASRFFAKNLSALKECNGIMVKLARCFQKVADLKFIEWDAKENHVFLQLVIGLMLKRSDEKLIRDLCSIFKTFIKQIPNDLLKRLANFHMKNCRFILHKMSKVSTFYTQLEILEILHIVLKCYDDGGFKIFELEGASPACDAEKIKKAFNIFSQIDDKALFKTFRKFLEFFNEELMVNPFTISSDCYLFKVNGKSIKGENLQVNFNLRNLSISFASSSSCFKGKYQTLDKIFIEMEGCKVNAEGRKFKNPDHIELLIKPSRYQIFESFNHEQKVEDMEKIDSIILVVMEKTAIFWRDVYPRMVDQAPMERDNLTDQESIVSFQTIRTIGPDELPSQIDQIQRKLPEQSKPPTFVKAAATPKVAPSKKAETQIEVVAPKKDPPPKELPVAEKPRKLLKVEPMKSIGRSQDAYDFLPAQEKMPPAREFLNNARLERLRNSQTQGLSITESTVPDNSHDISWNPKAHAVQKRSAPKKKAVPAQRKTQTRGTKGRQYSTDIDDEIMNVFGEALEPRRTNRRRPATKKTVVETSDEENVQEASKKPVQKIQQQISLARRAALNKVDENRKRAAPPNVAPITKKARNNFDKLLASPIIKPVMTSGDRNVPPKKRVSFDESVQVVKAKRIRLDETVCSLSPPRAVVPLKSGNPEEFQEESTDEKVDGKVNITTTDCGLKAGPEGPMKDAVRATRNTRVGEHSSSTNQFLKPETKANQEEKVKQAPSRSVPVRIEAPARKATKQLPIEDEGHEDPNTVPETLSLDESQQDDAYHAPYTQHAPEEEQIPVLRQQKYTAPVYEDIPQIQDTSEKVIYDYEVLGKNKLLGKYITDTISRAVDNDFDSANENSTPVYNKKNMPADIESYTMTRQQEVRIQKSSPTIFRTVQIQQINYVSPTRSQSNNESDSDLNLKFDNMIKIALKPTEEKAKKIRDSICSIKRRELKAKLREKYKIASESCEQFSNHIQEHIKLLKRVHQSKSTLKQLFTEKQQINDDLQDVLEEITTVLENASKYEIQAAANIRKEIADKHEQVKRNIWDQYINDVSGNLTSMISKYKQI